MKFISQKKAISFLSTLFIVVILLFVGGHIFRSVNTLEIVSPPLTSSSSQANAPEIIDGKCKFDKGIYSDCPPVSSVRAVRFDQLYDTKEAFCSKFPDTCGTVDEPYAKDEVQNFHNIVNTSKVGDTVLIPNPHSSHSQKGKIVMLGTVRGVLEFASDTQAVGTHVSLYWFDKFNNLLSFYKEMPGDTLEQSAKTKTYQTLMQEISNFNPTGDSIEK